MSQDPWNQEMPTLEYISNLVLFSQMYTVDQEAIWIFTEELRNRAEEHGILILSIPGKQRRQWEGMN